MITKGTAEYKQAQELANKLEKYAKVERWNQNSFYGIAFHTLGGFIDKMEKVEGFASEVAKTVNKTMTYYTFCVARISSKQAWILATSAIENGIEMNDVY